MPRSEDRKTIFSEVFLEWSSGKREARISDLSLGGCFVDTIASATEGESVALDLKTSSSENLHLTGVVAYILTGVGFGIRFTDLAEETKTSLQRFLAAP